MNEKYHFTTSFKIIENNNYDIILVEDFPCERKEQLLARERFFIENTECINKVIPTRTHKEYREENKEQINEKAKQYYENNKEKIKDTKKEYRLKHKEILKIYDKQKYLKNKEKIKEKNKEYRENNKEKIKEKIKEWCENNKEKSKKNKKKVKTKNLHFLKI